MLYVRLVLGIEALLNGRILGAKIRPVDDFAKRGPVRIGESGDERIAVPAFYVSVRENRVVIVSRARGIRLRDM